MKHGRQTNVKARKLLHTHLSLYRAITRMKRRMSRTD